VKALVVRPGPSFSVADVARGWVKGLKECGVTTADFNLDDRLGFYSMHPMVTNPQDTALFAAKGIEAACYEMWPDVVFIISGFYVPPAIYELLRLRGHKVVIVHTESPYEDDRQLARAAFADLNVLNDPTNIDRFPNAMYAPHAYDPDFHHPRPVDPEAASDFCFVGTGYASRARFFEACDWSGIDVALAGNWSSVDPDSPLREFVAHDIDDCCPNDEAARLYTSTKVAANLYRKEGTEIDGWAMGPREVELAACGTFFLREPRPEGDEVFPMLPTFTEPGDFTEKLRWWLSHDSEREAAALKAREAITDRTFPKNVAAVLDRLGF
jgi:hypothetical protein